MGVGHGLSQWGTHMCDGSGASVVLTGVLHMVQHSGTHRSDGCGM